MGRVFSGVQPSAEAPHLGNYLGAFRNWVALQERHECFYCVVDLHSMTLPWDPVALTGRTRQVAASLLACGIDPDRSVVFVQSAVSEHTELAWILTCLSRMGELSRMIEFKEKSRGQAPGAVGAGLLMYPVLMAADVLAYRAEFVPVGEDQRQHLELMRELAERFNRLFGDTFPVPEALIAEKGARVMALDDPVQKMSKSSDQPGGSISMIDPPDVVRRKVGRAVTDSGREIRYVPEKPALSNLLEIFSLVTGRPIPELEAEFEGRGYAEFKEELAEALVGFLEPFQRRYAELVADPAELDKILRRGGERARAEAADTMRLVRERAGLVPPD